MSIKKNTIANYLGQGYTTLIGIIMLPLYLKYLGAEAYGLVGFFTVMQSWLMLLDAGLTPTLSRQVALKRDSNKAGVDELHKLLRSIEIIFFVLSITTAFIIWSGSDWIAAKWLTVHTLSYNDVAYCITLMGVIVGMRWFSSLYRSGLQGLELMVWLNTATIVILTLRFVGVYAILRWVTQDPRHFFDYQLLISILELFVFGIKFYKSLPPGETKLACFSISSIRSVIPFAGGIAYTSTLWILLTQVDKLILSHTLTLREYGYFALVAVVSNGLLSLRAPIAQAILPRMSKLLSVGKDEEMIMLYRKATQVVVAIVFPIAGVIALFSEKILYVWSGDRSAAEWAGPVLTWFVLGNAMLSIAAFQYNLQFAFGKLKLHVINSTINAVLQIPILAYAAINYGAIGVAYAWFILRLISFFIFPAIVHSRFVPGLHVKWLVNDIIPGLMATGVCLGVSYNIFPYFGDMGRVQSVLVIGLLTLACMLVNFLITPTGKEQISILFTKYRTSR